MKKLILGLAIFASIGTSAFAANPPLKGYKTPDSMGCMMLQECKEGVEEITSWKQFGVTGYEPFAEELDSIFAGLNKSGIKVFLADEKYFIPLARGLYYVLGNNMFLNKYYIYNPLMMVKVVRHESWHAAQDCMAGTLDNTFTAVILQDGVVHDWILRGARRTYPPNAVPYEAEAMYATFNPGLVIQALNACASEKPMWEVFEPTPMTREWLINNGYINKK
tara:strand:+ start:123 stop:785 length:663 start_codon:yes stop_codon:yes gene_type:complete